MVAGRRSPLVTLSLVLVALLAFPPSTLRASTGTDAFHTPASATSADHDERSPCHHGLAGERERAASDAGSPHDHGSAQAHAGGTDHHGSSGCCPLSLCVGTCGSACSGASAGAVLSGTPVPSIRDAAVRASIGRASDVASRAYGTPFRPPRARPAIAGRVVD